MYDFWPVIGQKTPLPRRDEERGFSFDVFEEEENLGCTNQGFTFTIPGGEGLFWRPKIRGHEEGRDNKLRRGRFGLAGPIPRPLWSPAATPSPHTHKPPSHKRALVNF